MAELKFSYGASISHGWQMTRKYWLPILLLSVVYIMFHSGNTVLQHYAGSDKIAQEDVARIYVEKTQRDKLYQLLIDQGYVDKNGKILAALQQLHRPADLALSDAFAVDRYKIYEFLDQYRYRLPFPKVAYYVLAFLLWVIGLVMSIGWIKISLTLARDQEPDIAELFTHWGFLIPYVLGTLCYALVVFVGFILLIVPGIILLIMLGMYSYLIVDKRLGPIAALKRSRVITRGQKWRLAMMGLVLLLLNLAGLLCLLVGVVVTLWISIIAAAYVFDRLESSPDVNGSTGIQPNMANERVDGT